ncbi:MAG: CoA-binding protein [Paludibacter sp.]|nr:CoA-binding protein [Paludibacter sp.]
MELITKQKIDHFFDCKTMAIAGASRDEKSFSAQVAKHLNKLGYNLWLVNPAFEPQEAKNQRVPSIAMLPSDVNHLLVLTNKTRTESIMLQAISKGIKNIWIQQQSETPEALELARENGVNTIYNHCIFMFSHPEGVHKFHYRIKKFFGGIPK